MTGLRSDAARLPAITPGARYRWVLLWLGLLTGLLAARPAFGQPLSDEKAALVAQGITPTILYYGDLAANLSGGKERGSTYTGALHLQALLDGGQLIAAPGLSLFVDVLDTHGGQPDGLVADAQGISNIAAPPKLRLYEGWLQYNSDDGRLSVLAGRYDLNTEFYRLVSATLFLNSSFGVGPEFGQTGRAGPSIYPDTSAGLRLAFRPVPAIVFRTAVLDGAPADPPDAPPYASMHGDGLLIVSELAMLSRPGAEAQPGSRRSLIGRSSSLEPYEDKLAVGGWYYTAPFDDLSQIDRSGAPLRHNGSSGVYVLLDKRLYTAPDDPGRQLSAFAEAGIGDGRVNRFGSYVGVGLAGRGFIPGHPDDELGIAAAIGINGSHFATSQRLAGLPTDPAETSIELTYLHQATSWLALQSDLQYVVDPNTDPRIANALAFQFQVEVSL